MWAGYVLIAIGAFRAVQLAMSFMHPAGSIVVGPKEIKLPRGAYRGTPHVLAPSDVKAVYFLRRSVPWNRSAPVLVIEVGDKAMAFPRDWFASEADQRRVVHALLAHLPTVRREAEVKAPAEPAAAITES